MIRRDLVGSDASVGLITIARHERRNALDGAHWQELAASLQDVLADGARAIVLTGDGTCFCAGGDLDDPDFDAMAEAHDAALNAIRYAPVPVVAAVNGPAMGAGVPLVLTCDLKVFSDTARLVVPAAALSRPVHPAAIAALVAHAGLGVARSMLLAGESIDAGKALSVGFADRIGSLDDALAWAEQIASAAPMLLAYFKKELLAPRVPDRPDYDAFVERVLASEDYAEAGRARAERRPPCYRGL